MWCKRLAVPRVRLTMVKVAVGIIRALFTGENVNHRGEHFDVANARVRDLPGTLPPIGVAVSGGRPCAVAGRLADLVIATEPKPELIQSRNALAPTSPMTRAGVRRTTCSRPRPPHGRRIRYQETHRV